MKYEMQKCVSDFYMKKALIQANIAFRKNEVPIGAVIVDSDGKVLSRAYNKIESHGCQSSHAEVLAINVACKKKRDWRLNGCSLYVTLEPCLMCLGLIQLSRLDRVVFGARSPLFGAVDLKCGLEKDLIKSYAKNLEIRGGICDLESAKLLQNFFEKKRQKKG